MLRLGRLLIGRSTAVAVKTLQLSIRVKALRSTCVELGQHLGIDMQVEIIKYQMIIQMCIVILLIDL